MQKTALSFAACLLLIAAGGAHAQSVWKWKDASGQMHISDTAPPPGTPAGSILQRPAGGVVSTPATPAPAASTPDPAVSDLERKRKAAEKAASDKVAAEKAAVDKQNAAIRADNCQRAQRDLTGLKAGNRYATTNDKGEREVLDDAGRAAEIKRMQDITTQNCTAQ